jgi:hypothetical protein
MNIDAGEKLNFVFIFEVERDIYSAENENRVYVGPTGRPTKSARELINND